MKWLEHQLVRYALKHHPLPHEVWERLMRDAPVFIGLSSVERAHLRELTILFLQYKDLCGVQGLILIQDMAITIVAQACLPVLKLGLDHYDGWVEVVIYPGAFRAVRDTTDAIGLVSHQDQALCGESWSGGPVILSWDDVASDLAGSGTGHNVVVHEFAHKLDMRNGSADGMPPLHRGMVRQNWTQAFSDGFAHLQEQLQHHRRSDINPYGATAPAEFFAVVSEYFFSAPHRLHKHYPRVYEQLALFYLQDPGSRQPRPGKEATP
jgi:Mlc titration factor MtfA (ptsG expression regulator)